MAKILAFAGSARKDSYNKKLVAVAAEGARKAGAEVTLIDLAELDRTAGRVARAAERYERARSRLIEAGAAEAAPELLRELEARMDSLR